MLVLSRKPHEGVVITLEDGRTIEVVLIELAGNPKCKARLGFTAPKGIKIDRDEVHAAIHSNAVPQDEGER